MRSLLRWFRQPNITFWYLGEPIQLELRERCWVVGATGRRYRDLGDAKRAVKAFLELPPARKRRERG